MKILIATMHRTIVGGVETYLQTLVPALVERGHQVAMLYDYRDNREGATVDPPHAQLQVWCCDELRLHPDRWRELADWNPDVVYTHGLSSPDVEQKLQRSYPAVLYAHAYSGTCTTGRKCHAFPQIQPCERTFGPMCLVLHYPRRCGGLNPLLAWRMFQVEKAHNSCLPHYRAVLVGSRHMYSEFHRNGIDAQKLHLVQLPLTLPPGVPRIKKMPGGRLLFVGRLTDLKGVSLLIDALPLAEAKLGRKLSLAVAGDGPETARLLAHARKKQVDVEFQGWVNSAAKLDLMRQADLLVVPSLWPEPFGLVGIEAASMRLPAAGFAVGGIPEWLIPGRTGELAPAAPPTAEGLASAITRALQDPEHYKNLCQGAFDFSQGFTIKQHVAELEAILHSTCSVPDLQAQPALPS